MSKHTPGPWRIDGGGVAAGDVAVALVSSENFQANASLIAAAPDLLEALRHLVAAVEAGCEPFHQDLIAAQQALEKAEPTP